MVIHLFYLLILLFFSRTTSSAAETDKVIVGYWGVWDSKPLPIKYIPWSQITHINFGFATVNKDVVPALKNQGALNNLVKEAHENNVKVLLSIGGWYGSKRMDEMVSLDKHRKTCVDKVKGWLHEYDLDGVDIIDWRTRLPCNQSSTITNTTTEDHLLPLLEQLRKALGNDKLLTLGVGATPYPYSNVSDYQQVVDWITIMAHDTHVGQPTIGANSPLYNNDASSNSALEAWNAWMAIPSEQRVLGVPFYGYASKPIRNKKDGDLEKLTGPAHSMRPPGDADDPMLPDTCKRGYSGLWRWRSLRNTGILLDESRAGKHWIKHWDTSSQTPWLYNSLSNVVISYDDPQSVKLKTTFAMCQQARGIGVWDLAYDYYTSGNGQLLAAIHDALNTTHPKCDLTLIHPDADPVESVGTYSLPRSVVFVFLYAIPMMLFQL